MSEAILPLAMAALTLAGILAGYRVAMVLAGSAALFILASDLPIAYFNLLVSRIYANVLSNWLLVAVPMFIFMGLILETSGVAERSLRAAQRALGGSAAGMGLSVLVIGILSGGVFGDRGGLCCPVSPARPAPASAKQAMTTPRRRGWWRHRARWRSSSRPR